MKKSEQLKIELEQCKTKAKAAYIREVMEKRSACGDNHDEVWSKYYNSIGRELSERERSLENEIIKEINREVAVGDGVTLHLYSDSQAHTVISRTKCTLTIQRDKATRDFKPEWVPGGFSAICTNEHEQKWITERDPNGAITVCRWSEKRGCFTTGGDRSIIITTGRREHYDFNF